MSQDLLSRTLHGAAAGAVGTVALQMTMLPLQSAFPDAHTPETEDPASFMLWQVEKRLPRKVWMNIPKTLETAAGFGLSFGYGATMGALYGALRPRKGNFVIDGVALGLACWAIGYIGWLPMAGITPPIHRQTPAQIAGPLIEHVMYGVVTVAACDVLRGRF